MNLKISKEDIERFFREIETEENLAQELEERSNLKYPNGEKVKRNDLFIDLESKERYELDPSSEPYGYHLVVHRINEDNSVDLCIGGSIAYKMNDCLFDFNNAELLERNYRITSPLDNILSELK